MGLDFFLVRLNPPPAAWSTFAVGLIPDVILRARPDLQPGGADIAEVLRQAWGRLIRKQWLIFYPLALGVINTIAFLAVYMATGESLRWSQFFVANFTRWQYVRDHFFSEFAFTPALAAAVLAGVATSVLAAMIRAPYFRAIGGMGYPLGPRNGKEALRLSIFYLFSNLVIWVLPLATASGSLLDQSLAFIVMVVAILIVFADYVIVFEDLSFLSALRRSTQILSRRWILVVLIFVVIQFLYYGLRRLYGFYYQTADGVFILLPLSQLLVEAFVVLVIDLVLIFLYEQTRRNIGA